jgi:hypothetical protein
MSGGQAAAHAPVQFDVSLASSVKRYSVTPDWSTSTAPSAPTRADETVTVAGDVPLIAFVDTAGEAPLDPQAAATMASPTSAPAARIGRPDRRDRPATVVTNGSLTHSSIRIRTSTFPIETTLVELGGTRPTALARQQTDTADHDKWIADRW